MHAPLRVQILSLSCSFLAKNWKIIALLGVGTPPSSWGKSLIHHWLVQHSSEPVADPEFPRWGGREAQSCGSCMPQVEFEFSTWVPLKATTNHHSGSGWPSFVCLFVYANEWWEKNHYWNGSGHHCQLPFRWWLPPPITILAVALNSSSGGELKLYLGWKRNTQSLELKPIIWRGSHLLSWDKFVMASYPISEWVGGK